MPIVAASCVRPRLKTLFTVASAFAGGALVASLARAEHHDDAPHAMVEQLGRVLVQIDQRYVDPVDRDRLLEGAVRGMVAELDPHSEYLDAKDYRSLAEETTGRFGGVGVEVDATSDRLMVIAPIEGGPAERAGLRAGDEIIAVDGVEARGTALEGALTKLRGDPGTQVSMTVRRASDGGKTMTFALTREIIHVASVDAAALPKNVAWIRIRQFQDHSHAELVMAVGKVRTQLGGHLDGVVLDMRRNPGGLVDEAAAIADEMLDSGVIYTMRGHGGATVEKAEAHSGGVLSQVPIVLLIDEGSASAAELVAAALQDHHRATVVGANSFGKGSVQSIFELPGGAGLKLTTARYFSPNGRAIQGQGIIPDVPIESSRVLDETAHAPPMKERDLPHALPADEPTRAQRPTPMSSQPSPSPSTSASSTTPGVPSAHGPDLEHDFALRTAYSIVTGVLMKTRPAK